MNAAVKALREGQQSTFGLQLTSMIDMFTIILVFLLKSYSSSAIDMTPSKGLSLPASSATGQPIEALKLMVSKEGIYVDDKIVVQFENEKVPSKFLDARDAKFIRPLYDALNLHAEKSKNIAKQNETITFDGKIILQADQNLNYDLLRRVMYTSTLAGYSDFKFAVVSVY